jgi:hypothetical protein
VASGLAARLYRHRPDEETGEFTMVERERPSDERLREFAREHLYYEVWMLAGLTEQFQSIVAAIDGAGPDGEPDIPDLVTRNAQVESFAIHARVLIDFLYSGPQRPDDAVAADFFDKEEDWRTLRPAKTKELERVPRRVGKGVAHLTYERLEVIEEDWHAAIWSDLAAVVRIFAKNASADRLPDDVRERLLTHAPGESLDDVRRASRLASFRATNLATSTASESWIFVAP